MTYVETVTRNNKPLWRQPAPASEVTTAARRNDHLKSTLENALQLQPLPVKSEKRLCFPPINKWGQHCPHIFCVYDISYRTAPVVLEERILTACHCFFFEMLPPQNSRLPPLSVEPPQMPHTAESSKQRGPCRKGDTPSTGPILRMQKQLAADERVLQDRGNVPTRKYLGAVRRHESEVGSRLLRRGHLSGYPFAQRLGMNLD
jgi:hypothetical protein